MGKPPVAFLLTLTLAPVFSKYGPFVPVRLNSECRKCGELGADRPDFGGEKPGGKGLVL